MEKMRVVRRKEQKQPLSMVACRLEGFSEACAEDAADIRAISRLLRSPALAVDGGRPADARLSLEQFHNGLSAALEILARDIATRGEHLAMETKKVERAG